MKRSVLFLLLLVTAMFGFSQKGKIKIKGTKKEQTTTIPNPGNPSASPEVKQKQLPQIYDKPDAGSASGQNNLPGTQPKDTSKTSASTSADGGDKPVLANPPVNAAGTTSPTSADTRPMTTDPKSGVAGDGKPVADMKNGKGEKGEKGNKGDKGNKDWKKENQEKHPGEKDNNENGEGNNKERNHIPAQVEKSFAAQYPGASNAVWVKQNGNWTVSFNNNGSASTATYHSNGEKSSVNGQGKKEKKEKKNKG